MPLINAIKLLATSNATSTLSKDDIDMTTDSQKLSNTNTNDSDSDNIDLLALLFTILRG